MLEQGEPREQHEIREQEVLLVLAVRQDLADLLVMMERLGLQEQQELREQEVLLGLAVRQDPPDLAERLGYLTELPEHLVHRVVQEHQELLDHQELAEIQGFRARLTRLQ
jgi:hypothetical protein